MPQQTQDGEIEQTLERNGLDEREPAPTDAAVVQVHLKGAHFRRVGRGKDTRNDQLFSMQAGMYMRTQVCMHMSIASHRIASQACKHLDVGRPKHKVTRRGGFPRQIASGPRIVENLEHDIAVLQGQQLRVDTCNPIVTSQQNLGKRKVRKRQRAEDLGKQKNKPARKRSTMQQNKHTLAPGSTIVPPLLNALCWCAHAEYGPLQRKKAWEKN